MSSVHARTSTPAVPFQTTSAKPIPGNILPLPCPIDDRARQAAWVFGILLPTARNLVCNALSRDVERLAEHSLQLVRTVGKLHRRRVRVTDRLP